MHRMGMLGRGMALRSREVSIESALMVGRTRGRQAKQQSDRETELNRWFYTGQITVASRARRRWTLGELVLAGLQIIAFARTCRGCASLFPSP